MPKPTSGIGDREGNRRRVNDIDFFGSHLDEDGRRQWMIDNLRLSRDDADEQAKAINYFTDTYTEIHNGEDTYRNDMIDRALDNRNAPVYSGEQYRGIRIRSNDMPNGVTMRQFIQDIINSGTWKENGATSFSATKRIAESFAGLHYSSAGRDYIPVMINYKGRHGMPIKHMSEFASEDEVLHSRKQMKGGYDIVSHRWADDGSAVYITLRDRKRK